MRVYGLTQVGKATASQMTGDSNESRILGHLYGAKTATEDELEVVGGRSAIYILKKRGLIKELTA